MSPQCSPLGEYQGSNHLILKLGNHIVYQRKSIKSYFFVYFFVYIKNSKFGKSVLKKYCELAFKTLL